MTKNNKTRAIIISNALLVDTFDKANELINLCIDAGYLPMYQFSQKVDQINSSIYFGSGFIEKIKSKIAKIAIENPEFAENLVVITSNDITGSQRGNLKKILGLEVIDRTYVILKIFENNAHSKQAKLQVNIASLSWSKNHLINNQFSFSQVTSGGGLHNKGSGEKQIVLDKRHIDMLITANKNELEKIKLSRKNSRQKRNSSGLYKIAVVGYTNAGKSALVNGFVNLMHGDKTVVSQNNLFVTLETATRLFNKFGYMNFLLTDTVGFVRDLPTILVDAFKSTLEEIIEADLLVHVVDFSNNQYEELIATTNEILKEIGVNDIPIVYLYNKYDLANKDNNKLLNSNEMYTTLINQNDIEDVYHFICDNLSKNWLEKEIEIPYEANFAEFCADNYVIKYYKNISGYVCTVRINPRTQYKYDYLLGNAFK